DRLEAFYDNPNALRDYFRDIGRMVLAAEGRKANDSHADCYQYFCVPEYGTANGRLHFHAVHFMRSEERFSRNAETDLVCRLLLEKKKKGDAGAVERRSEESVQMVDADIYLYRTCGCSRVSNRIVRR